MNIFPSQVQLEKEKQLFDFDNIQSQLDKALGQCSRVQKERETLQLDADRYKEKVEKLQVRRVLKETYFSTSHFELSHRHNLVEHKRTKIYSQMNTNSLRKGLNHLKTI